MVIVLEIKVIRLGLGLGLQMNEVLEADLEDLINPSRLPLIDAGGGAEEIRPNPNPNAECNPPLSSFQCVR